MGDSTPAERRVFGQYRGVALNVPAFFARITLDCIVKAAVAQPMGRKSPGRHQSAAELMLPLRTRLESGQTVGDAVFDRRVVTGLKMQIRNPFEGAPIAAVE